MGKCPDLVERVSAGKRDYDMDSFFARSFHKRPYPVIFQVFTDNPGNIDHIVKGEWRFGIDIEQQEVGRIIRYRCRECGMEFEGCKVCQPDESIEVVAEHEMDFATSSPVWMGKDLNINRECPAERLSRKRLHPPPLPENDAW